MDDKQLALFDYGALDTDTRSFVQTKTAEIRILVKQTVQGIIDIRQRLIEVRGKLEHGQFLDWIEAETGIGKSTAYNFMSVAEKPPTGGSLDFSPKVLYLLSAQSTPEPARIEALERHDSGEHISAKVAKEITDHHKAELAAEVKAKQQTIFTQEERIKAIEQESHDAIIERDHIRQDPYQGYLWPRIKGKLYNQYVRPRQVF